MLTVAAALAVGATTMQAQITITASDMFNQVGQYYYAYCNSSNTTVTASVSIPGPASATAQLWDFSTGPQDITYRFDYIPASQGSNGSQFVALGATMAQQQVDQGNPNDVQFLYFKQDSVRGQVDFGFYDPTFSASQPQSYFTNANGLQDFPNNITYGSTWAGTAIFESVYSFSGLGDFPDRITYTSSDKVDAFGYVNLPNLGVLPCVRVHEAVEYDIEFDLQDGNGYQQYGTQYGLNYYWLAQGYGMAVQINATQQTSPPADDLSGGIATLVRMFNAYHPAAPPVKTYIQNFKIAHYSGSAILSWTALTGATSYTVQYSTNLASSTNWQTLTTTASNFAFDPAAFSAAAPRRYYRVMTSTGPK